LKTIMIFPITFVLVLCTFAIANAEMLFADDFEGGLSKSWITANQNGVGEWKVAKESGNQFLQKTGSAWTIISVDGVASLKDHKEIWATARIRCDSATKDEGTEMGLLINPEVAQGNWLFTVRAQSGQAGFDELAVAWHSLVPYKGWEVGKWHRIKIAVIDETFWGKVWPDGKDEPKDWIASVKLTSHLDEDGIGFGVDTNEVSFDDLIVADNEDSLVMAVSSQEKLPITWGKIKYDN